MVESKELGKNSPGISWRLYFFWHFKNYRNPKHNINPRLCNLAIVIHPRPICSEIPMCTYVTGMFYMAAMEETSSRNSRPQASLLQQRNQGCKVATAQKDILHHTSIARRCNASRAPGHDDAILLARSIRERQFST